MYCGGSYRGGDVDIVAVGYARAGEWACGDALEVCGPGGCIRAHRRDLCGGCGASLIDMSEAGVLAVCGIVATCGGVTVREVE